jgi:hypothetical protein
MTPKEKTIRKFTNLIDGCVKSNVSVNTIINYYEALLNNQNIQTNNNDNIINAFLEEQIKEMENNQEF